MKTTAARIWHLFAMAPALVLLTGAKAEGCWGEVIVEPQPPPVCSAGTHLETVCDDDPMPPTLCGSDEQCAQSEQKGGNANASCYDECVPDGVCPAGYVEQLQCAPMGPTYCVDSDCECPPNAECDCEPSYCEPVEEECWHECVPTCPEGTHPEPVCSAPMPEPMNDTKCGGNGDKDGCGEPDPAAPPPDDDCAMQCVPDGICPPGYQEVGVCEACAAEDGEDCEGSCWTECWPVEPTCPPGCFEEMICEDCANGEDCGGGCYSECVCTGEEPSVPPSEPKD